MIGGSNPPRRKVVGVWVLIEGLSLVEVQSMLQHMEVNTKITRQDLLQ